MYSINYNNYPMGSMIKMVWGCHDLYTGIVIRNLKYKMVIQTLTLNGKLHIEIRDFAKEHIRNIDYLL